MSSLYSTGGLLSTVYFCLFVHLYVVLLCFLGTLVLETENSSGKPWVYICLGMCLITLLGMLSLMEYIRWKCVGKFACLVHTSMAI